MRWIFAAAALLPIVLAGCTQVETGRIPGDSADAGYAAMQADQRVILTRTRAATPDRLSAFTFDIGSPQRPNIQQITINGEKEHRVDCAEPSPDALKAIAESFSASLKAGGTNPASGSVGQAYATAVGSIGMRTVMVQSIRDLAYRSCEAYMNGALGYQDYERIMSGAPQIILGLEAIDALVGPAPPPSIIVNGPTTTTSGGAAGTTTAPAAGTTTQTNTITPPALRPAPSPEVAKAVVQILCLSLAGRETNATIAFQSICKKP